MIKLNFTKLFLTITILFSFIPPSFSQDIEREPVFLPISVDEARLIALNNNLDIKLARIDSKIKGTELSFKESAFDTILNGSMDYTNDQRKQSSSIFGSKSTTNNYNIGIDKKLKTGTDVGIDFTNKREWTNSTFVSQNPHHASQMELSLRQPIAKNFFGLIDRGEVEIIKQEIKNAELDSYIKIEDAIISAEKAYWSLALAQEEFMIKKEMLKKAIRLFNKNMWKLKIGLIETGDLLASEANMHIRQSDLLLASNKVASSEELLKLALNLKNDVHLFSIDRLKESDFTTSFEESIRRGFKNRRDYMSIKNDISAKDINLKMKSNSRLPEIDLTATLAANGIDGKYYRAIEDISEDSNPKYSFGIEFKYPLENNEASSLHEKASLEKARSIIQLQKIERQIFSDIDETFRNFSVYELNMEKMKRVENLQEGKLSHEEARFQYGRSDSDTLIRYQEDLLNARLKTQRSYLDYKLSILDLMASEDSFLKRMELEDE